MLKALGFSKEQVGIGVVLHQRPDGLLIKHVAPGGPAAAGGVREGDVLCMVEGKVVDTHRSIEKAKQLILGPPGSRVDIVLLRSDKKFKVSLVRDRHFKNRDAKADMHSLQQAHKRRALTEALARDKLSTLSTSPPADTPAPPPPPSPPKKHAPSVQASLARLKQKSHVRDMRSHTQQLAERGGAQDQKLLTSSPLPPRLPPGAPAGDNRGAIGSAGRSARSDLASGDGGGRGGLVSTLPPRIDRVAGAAREGPQGVDVRGDLGSGTAGPGGASTRERRQRREEQLLLLERMERDGGGDGATEGGSGGAGKQQAEVTGEGQSAAGPQTEGIGGGGGVGEASTQPPESPAPSRGNAAAELGTPSGASALELSLSTPTNGGGVLVYQGEGDSRHAAEDEKELHIASKLGWKHANEQVRRHFTAAAMDALHPIGRLCVPFSQQVAERVQAMGGGAGQGMLDGLATDVNEFQRGVMQGLRVPLKTHSLQDDAVDALWGAIEAGVFSCFEAALFDVYLCRNKERDEGIVAACERLKAASPSRISSEVAGDEGEGGEEEEGVGAARVRYGGAIEMSLGMRSAGSPVGVLYALRRCLEEVERVGGDDDSLTGLLFTLVQSGGGWGLCAVTALVSDFLWEGMLGGEMGRLAATLDAVVTFLLQDGDYENDDDDDEEECEEVDEGVITPPIAEGREGGQPASPGGDVEGGPQGSVGSRVPSGVSVDRPVLALSAEAMPQHPPPVALSTGASAESTPPAPAAGATHMASSDPSPSAPGAALSAQPQTLSPTLARAAPGRIASHSAEAEASTPAAGGPAAPTSMAGGEAGARASSQATLLHSIRPPSRAPLRGSVRGEGHEEVLEALKNEGKVSARVFWKGVDNALSDAASRRGGEGGRGEGEILRDLVREGDMVLGELRALVARGGGGRRGGVGRAGRAGEEGGPRCEQLEARVKAMEGEVARARETERDLQQALEASRVLEGALQESQGRNSELQRAVLAAEARAQASEDRVRELEGSLRGGLGPAPAAGGGAGGPGESAAVLAGHRPTPPSSEANPHRAPANLLAGRGAPGGGGGGGMVLTGVGLTFKCIGGQWIVTGVKQGYEKALQGVVGVGDAIVAIDGVPTAKMSQQDLGKAVIGQEGTVCRITVSQGGAGAPRVATVKRQRVTLV